MDFPGRRIPAENLREGREGVYCIFLWNVLFMVFSGLCPVGCIISLFIMYNRQLVLIHQ